MLYIVTEQSDWCFIVSHFRRTELNSTREEAHAKIKNKTNIRSKGEFLSKVRRETVSAGSIFSVAPYSRRSRLVGRNSLLCVVGLFVHQCPRGDRLLAYVRLNSALIVTCYGECACKPMQSRLQSAVNTIVVCDMREQMEFRAREFVSCTRIVLAINVLGTWLISLETSTSFCDILIWCGFSLCKVPRRSHNGP